MHDEIINSIKAMGMDARMLVLLLHAGIVPVAKIETSSAQLARIVDEGKLHGEKKVVQLVNDIKNISAGMNRLLMNRTSASLFGVPTAGWVDSYADDYIKEGRVLPLSQMAVAEKCSYVIGHMEQCVRTVAINQDNMYGDMMTYHTMLLSVWASTLSVTCQYVRRAYADGGIMYRNNLHVLMKNQADAIEKKRKKLFALVCNEKKANEDSPMYRQMVTAINQCMCTMTDLLFNKTFQRETRVRAIDDWISYYLARCAMDLHRDGRLCDKVERELAATNAKDLVECLAMVAQISEDVYDYVDEMDASLFEQKKEIVDYIVKFLKD